MKPKIFFESLQGDSCHIGYFSTAAKAVQAAGDFLIGKGLTVSPITLDIARSTIKERGQYSFRILAMEAKSQYDDSNTAEVCKRFIN